MPESEIILAYPEQLDANYFSDFRDSVADCELRLTEKRSKQPGPIAAVEWLMPTVVTFLIAKPFVDALTKKAANEFADYAYPKIKNAIKLLVAKIYIHERLPYVTVTRDGTSDEDNSHILFSIRCATKLEHQVKFVFEKTYSADEYNELIDKAFETITDHHLHEGTDDRLSKQIEDLPEPKFTTIAMSYDTENNAWIARDLIGGRRDGG